MIHERLWQEIRDQKLFQKIHELGSEYLKDVFQREAFPVKEALEGLKAFDEKLQNDPLDSSGIIKLLQEYGRPATASQVGGRYFGFVNGGIVPAGLAARLLSDYWDQNTALQVMSPLSSKLESVVESWLKDLFKLPASSVAGFVSGSSMAIFCGLAAARYRILTKQGWDVNKQGLFNAPKVRIVAGRQAHSTVLKAVGLLGFGTNSIEWCDTDSQGRLIPESLPDLDENTILILQAGNVNTGAFDNFEILCQKAEQAGSWVHIDGAFGLWVQAVDELKYLTKGMERATSWSVDGHKTLNTPYDNGIILCSDEEALVSALHMSGSYIIRGEGRDGMYYTPEMSRRSRIIELWATLKFLGKSGIREMILGLHLKAKQFAQELRKENFEIVNEVVFNQALVHYKDNGSTQKILQDVQEQRTCWCGGSQWRGREVIRISVCSWATRPEDISESVKSFVRARENLTTGG